MGILIRASSFIAGWAVFYAVIAGTGQGDGANIGAGLLAFALVALASALWGFLDGRRMTFGRLTVVWGLVGVLMGLAVPVFTAVAERGFDWRVLAADLVFGLPFIAALVAGPALVGGAVGVSSGGHRPGRRTRSDP